MCRRAQRPQALRDYFPEKQQVNRPAVLVIVLFVNNFAHYTNNHNTTGKQQENA